jgi:hypothetical protein
VDLTSGIVTTFAGTGTNAFGGDGGPAPAASLPGYNMVVTGDVDGNKFIFGGQYLWRVDGTTNIIEWVAGKRLNTLFSSLVTTVFLSCCRQGGWQSRGFWSEISWVR